MRTYRSHALPPFTPSKWTKRGLAYAIVAASFILAAVVGMIALHPAGAVNGCPSGDQTVTIQTGNTLNVFAQTYHTTVERLQAENHLADPNLIYAGQLLCIPGGSPATPQPTSPPSTVMANPFPPGQCTWWAFQRYQELNGNSVPWSTNANAWQWTARAFDFGWQVSSTPRYGAIVDLQPGVEGAYSLGHVAVVEQVLPNQHVIASNLNWGVYPWQVTNFEFAPGAGVTFLWK